MNSGNKIRFSFKFKNIVNKFFSVYKVIIIVCLLFLILGIVSGIFTVIKYSDLINIDNIFDSNLLLVLKGERGVVGCFFSQLLVYTLIMLTIIFLNFRPWMISISLIIIFFLGYVIGYNVTVFIILFSVTGLLNALFIILPLELLICFLVIIIAAIAIKRNLIIKKFGCQYYDNTFRLNIKMVYLYLFILGLILILIKSLLIPIIRVTIIIN